MFARRAEAPARSFARSEGNQFKTGLDPCAWPLIAEQLTVSFHPVGGIFGNFGKEASM
jgi:hypothetical protein